MTEAKEYWNGFFIYFLFLNNLSFKLIIIILINRVEPKPQVKRSCFTFEDDITKPEVPASFFWD